MALKSLSTGKQYKNVYTILEKVKKGEIKSYYKDDDYNYGLFGKINFYKKDDLINPHMHYIDERRIDSIMDSHFVNNDTIRSLYNKFAKSTSFKKLPDVEKPNFEAYIEKFKENYRKFPKHLTKDIFKMYYHQMQNLDFEDRTEKNHTKFKFLENSNNPVGKIMTENSNLKSAIFARSVMSYFLSRLTKMDFIEKDESEKIKNGLQGGSEFNNGDIDNALDKMLGDKNSKKEMDDAIKNATDLCKDIDENISDDLQEKMFTNADNGGSEAGKISKDYIKKVVASLENINLSMGSLKEKIKKLMDKSTSYFSAKKETVYEDLLSSSNVSGIEDFELLHPKLRKIFLEDITVKNTKSIGKIDIYIDNSGSMSSSCGQTNKLGGTISKMDFCKSFTAKLKEMDMLNNVYVFDNKVKPVKNDIISIAMLDCGGGTTIDAAVKNIEKNNVNAIVITDAEDQCNIYNDKAFFIGVYGARFSHFRNDIIKEYSDKDQVIVFDGNKIIKIGPTGHYPKENVF